MLNNLIIIDKTVDSDLQNTSKFIQAQRNLIIAEIQTFKYRGRNFATRYNSKISYVTRKEKYFEFTIIFSMLLDNLIIVLDVIPTSLRQEIHKKIPAAQNRLTKLLNQPNLGFTKLIKNFFN